MDSYQNWDMLDEPFTQQAPLNTESTECEELSDRSSQPDPDQGLYSFENFHQVGTWFYQGFYSFEFENFYQVGVYQVL